MYILYQNKLYVFTLLIKHIFWIFSTGNSPVLAPSLSDIKNFFDTISEILRQFNKQVDSL